MNTNRSGAVVSSRLRAALLVVAYHQDALAAEELAATPYWSPCAPTVLGHRTAADALRAEPTSS